MERVIERRTAAYPVTLQRAEGEPPRLAGLAAVFYRAGVAGTEYELFPGLVERIDPGAFDAAMGRDDPRALYNHDPSQVLGRLSAGTLTLRVTDEGLEYTITPPETQVGRDVITLVDRGDVTGSSFAFIPVRVEWTEGRDGQPDIRTIKDLELYDVGPVTYPAYEATRVSINSGDIPAPDVAAEWGRQRAAWRARRPRIPLRHLLADLTARESM